MTALPVREEIREFILRLITLIEAESLAESTETSLLFSNCSYKHLETKGLVLSGLSIAKTTIGLGGKTLIELERSSALHESNRFPPHSFKAGDIVQVRQRLAQLGTRIE
jgi:DNA polymerase alpha-associated DNA helicase A